MSRREPQSHFFVVRTKDGRFLGAYGTHSQAPKMYVRIGDARKWAETVGGEVLVVVFEDAAQMQLVAPLGRGCVLFVPPASDDSWRKGRPSRKKSKTRSELASEAIENG